MKEKYFESKKGFTLIEMMVVVAIVGITTAVVMANYSASKTRHQIRNAAREFASMVREVQNNALTGKRDPANSNRSICRYQIATNDANSSYSVSYLYKTGVDCSANPGTTTLFSNVLPYGVRFSGSDMISFTLPHGEVFDSSGAKLPGQAIAVTLEKDGVTLDVCVYGSGKVEEKTTVGCP